VAGERARRWDDPRSARPTVLIYGESPNDTRAIAALIEGLCPALVGRVKPRRSPLMLIKGLEFGQLGGPARKTATAIRAELAVSDVTCVFLHEDADAVEPAHEPLCVQKETALQGVGCSVYAVTPAWEIEAWWLMWPVEVQQHNPSWRRPDRYVGRSVGEIANAKEVLRRLLRPPGVSGNFRDYEELDSPGIAARVRDSGKANCPGAISASYERFLNSVADCCNDG